MSYNRKLTDYALLPIRAFPLDARSHFKNFAVAYEAINNNTITTVEQAAQESYQKIYYKNQIITTTKSGIWQVVLPRNGVILYFEKLAMNEISNVSWNTYDWRNNSIPSLKMTLIQEDNINYYKLYCDDNVIQTYKENEVHVLTSRIDTLYVNFSTNLIPLSGVSGGGGSSGVSDVKVNGKSVVDNSLIANIELGELAFNNKITINDVDQTLLDKINYITSVANEFEVVNGKLELKSVSTDKFTQGEQPFILDSGKSNI